MDAIIAAAGMGHRIGTGTDKPLLGVGTDNLIGHAVRSLTHVGCTRFEIVCNEFNVTSVRRYITSEFPNLTFGFPVQKLVNGTAGAARLALARLDGPCFVSWCDMFVRVPDPRPAGVNVIFGAAVDPSEAGRYERIAYDASGVVTEIQDRGDSLAPVFGSVGVFYLTDARLFDGYAVAPDGEVPFESLVRQAIAGGVTFVARAAISFVDFGVRSAYEVNEPLFKGVLG